MELLSEFFTLWEYTIYWALAVANYFLLLIVVYSVIIEGLKEQKYVQMLVYILKAIACSIMALVPFLNAFSLYWIIKFMNKDDVYD